jgi:hypothetical protein
LSLQVQDHFAQIEHEARTRRLFPVKIENRFVVGRGFRAFDVYRDFAIVHYGVASAIDRADENSLVIRDETLVVNVSNFDGRDVHDASLKRTHSQLIEVVNCVEIGLFGSSFFLVDFAA